MAFVLIWLGSIAVLGGILTLDAPFWPRLIGIVPAAALLAAVALDQILELGRKVFGRHAVVFISALIAILLAVVGYLNWNQYYSAVKENASAQVVTGRSLTASRRTLPRVACLVGLRLLFVKHIFWPGRTNWWI